MAVKNIAKKIAHRVKKDNETGARRAMIEDLFYDFHRSRSQVYMMNFVRGIFFGVGSLLGGTIVVALLLWALALLADIPGGIGEFIQYVVDTVETSKQQ